MALFGGANVVGGIVVYLYLAIAGQETGIDTLEDLTWGPILLGAYGAVAGPFGLVFGVRALRALAWKLEDRAPTRQERLGTLLLPRRFVALSALIWTGANVAFAIANAINGDDARFIIRSFIGTALGAATTGAACYLLVERALRPVFAQVLRDGPMPMTTVGVRPRIGLAWALGSGIPLLGIATAPIDKRYSISDLAALAALGLGSGALLIVTAARSVSDRLAQVRDALARVQAGDLTVEVTVDEAGEVGTLQAGVNAMVHGLRERQVLADLFGRHVGDEVARRALEDGVHLGGEQRDVSVLFVDVTGSVGIAASRPPGEVVALLNELFAIVVRVVGEEGGWVDKFEGDAAMCVFGAPAPLADHPSCALRAAQRLRRDVGEVDVDVGIGVSSGIVVAGNVGSEARFEYTVIGDPVNEAARLTEAAKARPSRLLAAARTVERAVPGVARHWSPAPTVVLRGRPEPTATYEPVA